MTCKIFWHTRARKDLRQLYEYISVRNVSAANKTVSQIVKRTQLLITNPHMAAIEPSLIDLSKTYRSLVVGNYKVVYMVEDTAIAIICIWDCRQNPAKLIESLT